MTRSQRDVVLGACATGLLVAVLLACRAPDEATSAAPTADEPALALSPGGEALGPLSAETRLDAARLRALFPAATVVETTEETEGEPYRVLAVDTDTARLLIRPGRDASRIHSVEILEGSVVAGLGVEHGDTFAEIYPPTSAPVCRPGVEEASGQVLCRDAGHGRLTLVFAGSWNGPDGTLPPPQVLREWTVRRLLWRPPGPQG